MLNANLISALQTLANTGKPVIAAASDTPKPVNSLEPGQQLLGTVQSKVNEGLFKVQVAGQSIQMRLPGNIKSGDTIRLEVITTQPRITFGMIASTHPLSTPEQIGSTARLLSNLADQPLERPSIQQIARNTVWQATDKMPDSKQLAGALRVALTNSGLFYESHQAQWVHGERSTAQLLVEPQNQLTGKQPASIHTNPLTRPDELYAPTSTSAANTRTAVDSGLHIARELLPLVQQQLHALETHQITWIGQVWPGQQMQWEIQGQPEQPHGQQPHERQWSTEMELNLPNLGDVHARLTLAENGLRLTLHAADSTTAQLFNRDLYQLGNSLADAGITLTAAVVEKS